MKLIAIACLLSCFLLSFNTSVSLIVLYSKAFPNTAHSTSSKYTIILGAIIPFETNFEMLLRFSSAFRLQSLTACQLSVNGNSTQSTTCTLNSKQNTINFKNISRAQMIHNITLAFNTATALFAGSFAIDLEYYQPGYRDNLYGSNTALITIVNAPMACTLTSTSDVVGAAVNFTLAYSPSVFISPGSILKVDFPPWSAYKLTNFPNASSSSVCSSQCNISSPNSVQSFSSQILTYSSLYPNQSTSNMTLTLSKARNPASTQPITITVTLLYSRSTFSQPSYMSCSTTLSASTPNQFKSVSFGPTSYAISQSSVGSLSLSLANPISSITQLMISFSTDLNITFKSKITNQGTIPQALPTGNPNSILIGNLTNSANSFSTLHLGTFSFRNAPYGNYPLQVTFTTMNPVGNRFYAIDTTTLQYTFNTSQITSASVTALHNYVGAVTYLIFTFTSINQLIPESKVILTLPPQIVPTKSSSCFCSISFSTCVQLNTTSFLITLNRVVSGGTAFVIYLRDMQNPATTTPTSPFSLTTYYHNTSTPTDVLKRIVTLTAKPVPLHSASVASSSLVADSPTNKVDFKNRNSLHLKSANTETFPAEFSSSAEVPLKRQYSKPKGPSNIFLRRKHNSY